MSLFKRKTKQSVVPAPVVVDVDKALDEARVQLETLGDAWLRDRSLTFAQSLLEAVGEDPATPQNQLLVHRMAVENLRAREALVSPRR